MRIAFVHPRAPSAEGTGAAHSATQIARGLAQAGHDICIYCTRQPKSKAEVQGIELRYLAGNSNHPHTETRLNRELNSRVDEIREFDILHSYLTPLIPSLSKIRKNVEVRTVVTLNAYGGICAKNDLLYRGEHQCQSKSKAKCLNCITQTKSEETAYDYLYKTASQLMSLRLINKAESQVDYIDRFQALTPHVEDYYSRFGYDRDKIRVIPNILDTRFDIEHSTGFSEPFNILYVGSLNEKKGVDRLIEVFSYVRERSDKEVTLTIVGNGELKEKLEQEVRNTKLSKQVEVTGKMPYEELPAVYSNHDIFMYPGRWNEPFGRVFLESMAAGTPIVSTDVGSVGAIIGDSGVVTEQSVSSLAKGVLSILNQKVLRNKSEIAKQQIENYRRSKVIPEFEALYKEITT
jgi:glycosyltransferase involved in cell wall biosynthesis